MKSKNQPIIEKDKHHISWKNHNIDFYIKKALDEFLKKEKRK